MARKHRFITAALAAAAMMGLSSVAQAATSFEPFYTNYSINSAYAVKDIAIFETSPDGSSSITNSFSIGEGASTITNPFVENAPVNGAFLLGVASGLASDNTPAQDHLVLFANDAFVNSAENIAFGTLFPNTNETTLITSLETIGGQVNGSVDDSYTALRNFQFGDASSSPNGSVAFNIGDPFEEIAFSNGQIIGSGASFATPAIAAAVPETSTWAMMILGIGAVGAMMRRARRSDDRFTSKVRAIATA